MCNNDVLVKISTRYKVNKLPMANCGHTRDAHEFCMVFSNGFLNSRLKNKCNEIYYFNNNSIVSGENSFIYL